MPSGYDGKEDMEAKFDPAAEIWEKQRKKEMEASMQKYEAKSAQLDKVRKQVKLEDTKSAMSTWGQAEAALKHALGNKRQAAMETSLSSGGFHDNGMRKHGEAVKQRKAMSTQIQQATQDSPPLQRTLAKAACSSAPASPASGFRTTNSREECLEKREKQRKHKASVSAENKLLHDKKRLRNKVATVLIEVRKRQDLHQLQEKAKKFREQRYLAGRGPAASLGDSDEYALGLSCFAEPGGEQAAASPRRSALMESLSLEELGMLREHPAFFFTGNAIAGAMSREQAMQASRSLGALPSVSSTSSADVEKAPKGLWIGSVDANVFEDLIEFFSVSNAEKSVDVSVYARNLRTQLLASTGRNNHHLSGGSATDVNWRKRLCRSEAEEQPQEEQPATDESLPKPPLEMMPCLGRHPQIRDDRQSPTLQKVREVYSRRDEQDAQWLEEKREAISRRVALNAFKAREQQRELQLQDFKQKELHKVRMLQAEEKKAMLDAEIAERTEVLGIQKIHRLMVANDRAERLKEEKRDQAQMALETWRTGVERAQQYSRMAEWEKRKDGERWREKYAKRLTELGERKRNVMTSQGQKNDELKKNIQASLSSQMSETNIVECMERAKVCKEKQEAAMLRRHQYQLGSRYGFVEKAFGANADCFDAKHHSVAVDRRGKSWQSSADAWKKVQGSFSAPVLPPPRPLSPGGIINEASFMALTHSGAFKTDTSAVALA